MVVLVATDKEHNLFSTVWGVFGNLVWESFFCEPHGLHLKLTMISFADFHSTARETSCMRGIMLVYLLVMTFLSLNVSTSIRRNFARLSHFCNLILLQRGIPNNAVRLNPVKEPCVCSGLLAVDFWLWNPDS